MSCYQCHFKINADELMYINREPTIINLPFIIAFNYYIHTRDAGITVRNSHQRCSVKKKLLLQIPQYSIFIYTGKHLCWSLFSRKLHAWWHATLLKKDSNTGVFLWIWQKFLTVPISKNICSYFWIVFSCTC